MFLKSKLIKHDRMMDVCAEVLSHFEGSDYYKLKIRWVNMGYLQSYYIFSKTDYIKIMKKDLTNWEWCRILPEDICYRNSPWKQIERRQIV